MNPELKAKWVTALRSGDYDQAKNSLRSSDGYCCIGVLCEVSGLGEFDVSDQFVLPSITDENEDPLRMEGEITRDALPLFGLAPQDQQTLISMNDANGKYEMDPQSFSDIANYIEEHL